MTASDPHAIDDAMPAIDVDANIVRAMAYAAADLDVDLLQVLAADSERALERTSEMNRCRERERARL